MPYPKQHRNKGPLIYMYTGPTNKKYVGQTLQRFEQRITKHKSKAKNTPFEGCVKLNAAINKYGFDTFKTEILLFCNEDELDRYEEKMIIKYNSLDPHGYNLLSGGNSNKHQSNISKKKASISHIRNSMKKNPDRIRYGCIYPHKSRIQNNGKQIEHILYSIIDHPLCKFMSFKMYISAVEYLDKLNLRAVLVDINVIEHEVGIGNEFSSLNTHADIHNTLLCIVKTIESKFRKEDRWKRINNAKCQE